MCTGTSKTTRYILRWKLVNFDKRSRDSVLLMNRLFFC